MELTNEAIRLGILVDAIRKYGVRNISRLARLTGLPPETVNYKLTKQFPRLGLSTRITINYDRLGLKRVICEADINPDLDGQTLEISHALAQHAFLTYQARQLTIPGYSHFMLFAVPTTHLGEFRTFLDGLVSRGVFIRYQLTELEWLRHLSLDPQFYDFFRRTWHIDWKQALERKIAIVEEPLQADPTAERKIDKMDVFILKELQKDALQKLVTIARKLNVNPKLLRYHYHAHVEPMIAGYCVDWAGAPQGQGGRIMRLAFMFSTLEEHQQRRAREAFNRIPFTWAEGAGRGGTYCAFLSINSKNLEETMLVLRFLLGTLSQKARMLHLDSVSPDSNWSYTLPFEMADEHGHWTFDPSKAYDSIASVVEVQKIRGSSG